MVAIIEIVLDQNDGSGAGEVDIGLMPRDLAWVEDRKGALISSCSVVALSPSLKPPRFRARRKVDQRQRQGTFDQPPSQTFALFAL
jgi:hypothetical protein